MVEKSLEQFARGKQDQTTEWEDTAAIQTLDGQTGAR
jgi:hypothetical protein